ncbi:MAG: signal peptidase I [Bacteroidia bacterium]|nr:signal peptidase I [Bacteroidia bacterium]
MIMWCVAFLLTRIGLAALFKKAGINPLLAFIPIISWWFWIKLVNRPWWYMIGMVIPCINILFSFNITLDLLKSFGQNKFWQHFLGTVFTFFYLPIIAFRSDVKYLGGAGDPEWRKKNPVSNKGGREWADALLFAMYIAGGMRALYFDLYQIPTPSMESNLMVGDFLVVSRAKVGMRIPMTPITIPVVAHKDFLGFQAFTNLIELPYMRLPGWYTIKNNDVIVFNYPADAEDFPVDKRDNYVKRCVGIPGDSLWVKNGQVYINGKALPKVGKQQKRYLVVMKEPMSYDFLLRNNLGDYQIAPEASEILKQTANKGIRANPVHIFTWPENAENIKKDPAVFEKGVFEITEDIGTGPVTFPNSIANGEQLTNWNIDNYGPIYLPKRGYQMQLNASNWNFYRLAINKYEHANVEFDGKTFSQNGKTITSYTFKYGYYWMMGDNRYNSADSRFWGYVPEDHVVGKPLFTFFSIKRVIEIGEDNAPVIGHGTMVYKTKGLRLNRIFKAIE